MRIVYLSWPATEIAGGIKMAFRHVEALRNAGFEALIATPDGRQPGWFTTTAPVVDVSMVERETDILVFPENHGELLARFAAWPNRKTVFCQSYIMVFRGLGSTSDYREFGIHDIICPGFTTATFCRRRFPSLKTTVIPNYVDHDVFHLGTKKKIQIVFFSRKRSLEAAFIRDCFKATDPRLSDIPWVEISQAPERSVAAVLRESAVFLSLCQFESCALTILEAFACGCIVAGFSGMARPEYATAGNGFWAPEDDCLACADQLVSACRLLLEGDSLCRDIVEEALATAKRYSKERFTQRLVEYWRAALDSSNA